MICSLTLAALLLFPSATTAASVTYISHDYTATSLDDNDPDKRPDDKRPNDSPDKRPGKRPDGAPAGQSTAPSGSAPSDSSQAAVTASPKIKEVVSSDSSVIKVSKVNDDWFFVLPDSLLGRLFQTVTRFTRTPANYSRYGGEEVNEQTVYFELSPNGKNIFLRTCALYTSADTLDQINQAVYNSSIDPIIESFTLEAGAPKNHYKIKVNNLILSENCFSLPNAVKTTLGATAPLGNGATYVESIHSYPINLELRTVRSYTNPARGSTISVGLNTSFVLLPEEPMRARLFDPRVGYFTDGYYVFSDHQQAVEQKQFITRWRLEPKEEDIEKMKRGELVEPKKPIVYYIDPATPKQWRPYFIAGINDWNAAFEQAGFKNAIIGKEWPENDSTMSLEDARFAVVRYLASPIENAYGPQVHDPRSGEIIESHVGWYHNVMKLVHDWYAVQCGNVDTAAQKQVFSEELMGQLIRFVVSHEIGHTLGLRHNFGASSTVPVENLRDKDWVSAHGHTPSIMDYARFNYVAQPEDGITHDGLFPRVNDYDKWAIQWGYMPIFDATDSESDRYMLSLITNDSIASNPRLWWGDGEGYQLDPRRQTEDLSNDAVQASEYGIKNLKAILPHLQEWTYWGNDNRDANLQNMFTQCASQFQRYCGHVYHYLFGYYYTVRTVDEQGDAFRFTPLEKSKEVLPFFDRHIFSGLSWLIDQPYIKRLYPDTVQVAQAFGGLYLNNLSSGITLSRLNPTYPVTDYLSELVDIIFKETKSNKSVTAYRRHLQSVLANSLTSQFLNHKNSKNSDVTAAIFATLQDLQTRLKRAEGGAPDKTTKAHYARLSDQIKRALSESTGSGQSTGITLNIGGRAVGADDEENPFGINFFLTDSEEPGSADTGSCGFCNFGIE